MMEKTFNMKPHKKQIQVAAFMFVTLASVVGVQQCFPYGQDQALGPVLPPLQAAVPDAAEVGNVTAAMEQCRHLMALLKENDWSGGGLPMNVLQLPDRQFAEDRAFAEPRTISFVLPHQNPKFSASDSKQDDLAFYTTIYARRNSAYYKGEQVRHHPSGFYIVGLKNGDVFQVPIAAVRQVKGTTQNGVTVFPGMKGLRPQRMAAA